MGLLPNRKSTRPKRFGFFFIPSLQDQVGKRHESQPCKHRRSDSQTKKTGETVLKVTMDLVVKKPDFVKMRQAATRAKKKAMFGQCSYVRKTAMRSLRKTKKVSGPGEKPRVHSPSKFSIKNIRFWVSPDGKYGLVGPVKLTKNRKDVISSRPAGSVLETGGKVKFIQGLYRLPSGAKTWRRVSRRQTGKMLRTRSKSKKIQKRPFMMPALKAGIDSGAIMLPWKSSFGE